MRRESALERSTRAEDIRAAKVPRFRFDPPRTRAQLVELKQSRVRPSAPSRILVQSWPYHQGGTTPRLARDFKVAAQRETATVRIIAHDDANAAASRRPCEHDAAMISYGL